MPNGPRTSYPSITFSPIDRFVHRFTSWYTVEIPAAWASAVPPSRRERPETMTVPSSMVYTPVSALISVDLPAPFSPIRAWTSPGKSRKFTRSRALTPGKEIEMSFISTIGDAGIGCPSVRSPACAARRGWRRSRCHGRPRAGGRVSSSGPGRPGTGRGGSVLAVGQSFLGGLGGVERGALDLDVGLERLALQRGIDRLQGLLAEQRVVLRDEGQGSVHQGVQGRLGAVDGGDLDVLARREPGLLHGLGGTQTHLVVLREHELDVVVVGLQHGLEDALGLFGGPVGGLGTEVGEGGLALHDLAPPLVALVDDRDAGGALEHEVVGAVGEGRDGPLGDRAGDGDVVRRQARDIQVGVVGLDAAVDQQDGDLRLLRAAEGLLPAGTLRGRQQDQVHALIDERAERIDLGLLVEIGGGGELQREAGILGERVLDVLLVRLAPGAFGADGDETDGHRIVRAATGAGITR